MVLRYHSGEALPRPESYIRSRDVWLGNDSGPCSDRQNRVDDVLVSQRWPLHCAHQNRYVIQRNAGGGVRLFKGLPESLARGDHRERPALLLALPDGLRRIAEWENGQYVQSIGDAHERLDRGQLQKARPI